MNNWGMVELFRHQYGELPKDDDKREIDFPLAFKKAAESVGIGKCDTFNAASMLNLAAEILEVMNFSSKYSPIDGLCFGCQKNKGTVRGSIGDAADKFEFLWCDECCKKILSSFKESEEG